MAIRVDVIRRTIVIRTLPCNSLVGIDLTKLAYRRTLDDMIKQGFEKWSNSTYKEAFRSHPIISSLFVRLVAKFEGAKIEKN